MALAMIMAGGFDYLVNVLVGRWLTPTEFFVFVTVTALLQIMVQATNVIRNVVAFYSAEATVSPDAVNRVGAILRRSWRWAWKWGLVGTVLMALISPLLARWLHIDTSWPLWAASLALLLLFLRPVTDGTLQGVQHFYGLGSVQMLQSFMRLVLAGLLVWLGLQATGAILALPLGSTIALILAAWLLQEYFRAPSPETPVLPISWRYSAYSLVGLLAFAIMVNVDPILVRRFFGDAAAAAYGPVVTLAKINLFIPLGISLVFFPKATQRRVAGRDARPVLLLALGATLIPGLLLTALYWLFPAEIVQMVFGDAYTNPGILLAMVGLATTFYAGAGIWLNYALSLEDKVYVFVLAGIVVLQIAAMILFHNRLVDVAIIMIITGITANLAGAAVTLRHE